MNVVIIGNGGHSKVVKDILLLKKNIQIVGYLDDKFEEYLIEEEMFNGPISAYQFLIDKFDEINFIIAIGHNYTRKQIVNKMNLKEHFFYDTCSSFSNYKS